MLTTLDHLSTIYDQPQQVVTKFDNVIILGNESDFKLMTFSLMLNHFVVFTNTVVHVDVAKALIELKSDVQCLIETVLNPGIKVKAILDQN